jgi:hypothetical protein
MESVKMFKFKDDEFQGKQEFFKNEEFDVKEKILVAKKAIYKKAVHAWAERGLPMLDLGNGYGLTIVAKAGEYGTIQLFRFGINQAITNQTYTPVKKEYITKEVKPKKLEPVKFEVKTEVKEKNLFEFEGD